jgi:hypothetical protein
MATHIRDEDTFLRAQADALGDLSPHLAHQIALYRMVCRRFNSHHIRRLRQIVGLVGFTGVASVGISINAVDGGAEAPIEQTVGPGDDDKEDSQELIDLQEDQEDQEEEEQLDNDIIDILSVTMDCVQLNP